MAVGRGCDIKGAAEQVSFRMALGGSVKGEVNIPSVVLNKLEFNLHNQKWPNKQLVFILWLKEKPLGAFLYIISEIK